MNLCQNTASVGAVPAFKKFPVILIFFAAAVGRIQPFSHHKYNIIESSRNDEELNPAMDGCRVEEEAGAEISLTWAPSNRVKLRSYNLRTHTGARKSGNLKSKYSVA
ncbi:Hypothetical predicted protein [Octopus vulgaris]|uniref:Uncharacterized protein n=1 Tax=Octopus vulgaris TaxID=6645 RepID=A0AA36BNQ9_OCTVU|nr:Hypothetical predicted protein [Octopus vulgaris]